MARAYTLKRRSEQQAETRRRIVQAAVDLHASAGPARTSFSMVAQRAGVQRHTLYAHFPDERSLLLACSALTLERDPLPDPALWAAIGEPGARLAAGLRGVYAWYARNRDLLGCVLRDARSHALTREVTDLRFGPFLASCTAVLGAELNRRQRAMLTLALGFETWLSLHEDSGLKPNAAVDLMAGAILKA